MKALIAFYSDTGNTRKVAEAIASGLMENGIGCSVRSINELKPGDVKDYDVLGFGAPVKYMNAAREMREFLDKIPSGNKKAFVYCTYGDRPAYSLTGMKKRLKSKGYTIIGEYATISYDVWLPLKLIGGINKGRPNQEDLKKAGEFGRNLKL